MDTQKIAGDYRMMKWAEIMKMRQDSGQSVKDFCESSKISRNQYYYWQRKLRKLACMELIEPAKPQAVVTSDWVELKSFSPSISKLEIQVAGCSIYVDDETDLGLLQRVCQRLGTIK